MELIDKLLGIFKKKRAVTIDRESISVMDDSSVEILGSDEKNHYSDIISDVILEEIKKRNNMEYISDILIKKLEKYPKLVDLLLKGSISQEMILDLNIFEKLTYLPNSEEDLQCVEFFEVDEKLDKLISLLNNRINHNDVNDNYQCCYVDLDNDFETEDFHNEVESFFPNLKINLGNETLTKTSLWSRFVLYFPKSKHKRVSHNFFGFITGEIKLDEEMIIQMSYETFHHLDEAIIDKLANCKIVFSEEELQYDTEENIQSSDDVNYKLVKFNHLLYIIENSSLDNETKEKLLYKLKYMYTDDICGIDLEVRDQILPLLNGLSIEEIEQLTKEFELNIDAYLKIDIEKPAFNASYYIDEEFPDLANSSISDVIDFINYVPDNLKTVVLKESRILRKLNISTQLDETQFNNLIYLFSTKLSLTTKDFVRSLNFDVQSFMENPDNDYKSLYNINPIIREYGIFDYLDEDRNISIADLLGHDASINCGYYKGKNILYTFENFFQKNGDGYHTRALGLLEYESGEQLLHELEKRNHDTRDMKISEIADGKYIISNNGLHRFTVLRFHYLLDCMKKEKSAEELRELYTIPVTITSKVNYKRTYCNYLIQIVNPNISYISFNDRDAKITIYYKSDDRKDVINEEILLNMAIQSVDMLDSYSLPRLQFYYNNIDSFHSFIDTYIPSLLDKFSLNSEEAVKK